MAENTIRANQLIGDHGVYNAIVVAKNGTRFQWNNTLGISVAAEPTTWPVLYFPSDSSVQIYIDQLERELNT